MLILIITASRSQVWVRQYGIGKNANYRCVIETYDHGFIFDALFYEGNHTYLWLFKTDINGNIN